MNKRKILFAAIISGMVFGILPSTAEPIIELAAPRPAPSQIILDDGSVLNMATQQVTSSAKKSKKVTKPKKKTYKKSRIRKLNYDKIAKFIEYGYYNEADNILKREIVRNPKNVRAVSLWTVSLAKQRKLDPVQNKLDKLLKIYPDSSNLHYAQGIVYYQRTTSSNMFYRAQTPKLLEDALNEFKKAVELDNKNAQAYNAAGVICLKLGNKDEAKTYFEKAVEIDKTYSLAIDNLGTIDFIDGKYEEAEKKFEKALKYNTKNTTAMYHAAQIAFQKKDYATALKYLNDALYINSNSPAIYNLMGKAYRAQGNEAAAINSFKQSIAIKPEFILSYMDLADVYQKRSDSEFAIEQLKTALSINPDYYDAKLKLADISLGCGKYKESIEVYSELVNIPGYNNMALKGLASAYYGQAKAYSTKSLIGSNKDLFNALDCINKAIEANSTDLELHLAKLKLTKITNQPEETKVASRKIIDSPANDLTSLVIKGEAYLTLNDFTNAQKMFLEAIELSDTQEDDLYLSEIFIYHKQYDSAESVLDKILLEDNGNEQALSDLDYIEKCKDYANNYYKSAQFFANKKNYPTAIEYLSRSLAINPGNAEAHLLLAELYEKQKRYNEALLNYQIYLALTQSSKDRNKVEKKVIKLEHKL